MVRRTPIRNRKTTSRTKEINAKNVALYYEGEVNDEFIHRLLEYMKKNDIKDILLTHDGNIVMHRSRCIHLNSGLTTLTRNLKLEGKEKMLHRLEMPHPAPDTLIQQLFPDGYDSERIRLRMGE